MNIHWIGLGVVVRIYLIVVVALTFMLWPGSKAKATLVKQTVSMTITEISGFSGAGFVVGDMIEVFNVKYDNEGTTMTTFWGDGSINDTWEIEDYPIFAFFDNAKFKPSKELRAVLPEQKGTFLPDQLYESRTYGRPEGETISAYFNYLVPNYAFYTILNGLSAEGKTDDSSGYLANRISSDYLRFGGHAEITSNPVPEPATMLLFGTGLIGLAGLRFRRKK